MPSLCDPYKIKGLTLRNRIGVSPMCQYCYQDGLSNDWQLVHLGARAVGGAGLIISEAAAVEAHGRITPFDVGIWSDAHIEPLSRVTRFIKEHGAVAGIQIAHAGRKACTQPPWEGGGPVSPNSSLAWKPVGPDTVAFDDGYSSPQALSPAEIHRVQESFARAAQRALAAGFEWLEVHAAHGYLLHSFYSPISNHRTDEYGGSFENRTRFLLETVRMIRPLWPEQFPLTVRISGTDWVENGWSVNDSVELARLLKTAGVDLIDCSSGGVVPRVKIPTGAGYQVPIAEAVRKGANIATAAVGLITAPMQAEEIIHNHRADIVLLGREMLRNPYWALHATQILGQNLNAPKQYLRAF